MTRKEKRLKRKKKAEKKRMRKIWYKGNSFQLFNYMAKSGSEMQENKIILTNDKYIKMEIEPIEINDETIEQKRRAIAEFYGMIKRSEERKRKNDN